MFCGGPGAIALVAPPYALPAGNLPRLNLCKYKIDAYRFRLVPKLSEFYIQLYQISRRPIPRKVNGSHISASNYCLLLFRIFCIPWYTRIIQKVPGIWLKSSLCENHDLQT
jgi:hypothetical protein